MRGTKPQFVGANLRQGVLGDRKLSSALETNPPPADRCRTAQNMFTFANKNTQPTVRWRKADTNTDKSKTTDEKKSGIKIIGEGPEIAAKLCIDMRG